MVGVSWDQGENMDEYYTGRFYCWTDSIYYSAYII